MEQFDQESYVKEFLIFIVANITGSVNIDILFRWAEAGWGGGERLGF